MVFAQFGSALIGLFTPSMITSSGRIIGKSSIGAGTVSPFGKVSIGIGAPQ